MATSAHFSVTVPKFLLLMVTLSPSFLTMSPVIRSPSFMVIWSANPTAATRAIAQTGSVVFIYPRYASQRPKGLAVWQTQPARLGMAELQHAAFQEKVHWHADQHDHQSWHCCRGTVAEQ